MGAVKGSMGEVWNTPGVSPSSDGQPIELTVRKRFYVLRRVRKKYS